MPENEKRKRKTHTSSEVKRRYNKKTYKNYNVNFRYKEDEDIIKLIENEKEKGLSTTEIFRKYVRNYIKSKKV